MFTHIVSVSITVSVKFALCEWRRAVWWTKWVQNPFCQSNGPCLLTTMLNCTDTVTVSVNRPLGNGNKPQHCANNDTGNVYENWHISLLEHTEEKNWFLRQWSVFDQDGQIKKRFAIKPSLSLNVPSGWLYDGGALVVLIRSLWTVGRDQQVLFPSPEVKTIDNTTFTTAVVKTFQIVNGNHQCII